MIWTQENLIHSILLKVGYLFLNWLKFLLTINITIRLADCA